MTIEPFHAPTRYACLICFCIIAGAQLKVAAATRRLPPGPFRRPLLQVSQRNSRRARNQSLPGGDVGEELSQCILREPPRPRRCEATPGGGSDVRSQGRRSGVEPTPRWVRQERVHEDHRLNPILRVSHDLWDERPGPTVSHQCRGIFDLCGGYPTRCSIEISPDPKGWAQIEEQRVLALPIQSATNRVPRRLA